MADCNETLEELHRFLDQELSPARANEIIDHLKICVDCQGAFEFHAELQNAIKIKAQRDELAPGFIDRLKGCFGEDVLG